jgi:hypothetical protein
MRSTTRNSIRLTENSLRDLARKRKLESQFLFVEIVEDLHRPFTVKTHTDIVLIEEDMEQLRKTGFVSNTFLTIKLLGRRNIK